MIMEFWQFMLAVELVDFLNLLLSTVVCYLMWLDNLVNVSGAFLLSTEVSKGTQLVDVGDLFPSVKMSFYFKCCIIACASTTRLFTLTYILNFILPT